MYICMQLICDCLSKKGSSLYNYKYLEIPFENIYILRRKGADSTQFSANLSHEVVGFLIHTYWTQPDSVIWVPNEL